MSERYLVSFCNNQGKLRLATVRPEGIECLIELALDEFALRGDGLTGVCIDKESIFVALQSQPPTILVLDHKYKIRSRLTLDDAQDVHGIAVLGSEIVVASTGTNQLLTIDPSTSAGPRVLWSDEGALVDRDHLNDLHVAPDGTLLMCRFGARYPGRMRSGVVVEVATGRVILDGLREPHSPYCAGSSLYVLESATGDLIQARPGFFPRRVVGIGGYARGLAIDATRIVIGKSGYRTQSRGGLGDSRLPPISASLADKGALKTSGVYFIGHDGIIENFVETSSSGIEIYQILPLPDPIYETGMLLTGTEVLSIRSSRQNIPDYSDDPRMILVDAGSEVELSLSRCPVGLGWHAVEMSTLGHHQIWTGPEPRFSLDLFLPKARYLCEIKMKPFNMKEFDDFQISINGEAVPHDYRMQEDGFIQLSLEIPASPADGLPHLGVITFEHASVSSQKDRGGPDERLLGFCVRAIVFSRLTPHSDEDGIELKVG
jgi:hypothetical protein